MAQNQNLLERSQCSKLLYSVEMTVVVEEVRMKTPHVEFVKVQQLDDMLSAHPQLFPFDKQFTEAQTDPILVLHSSGSTGKPHPHLKHDVSDDHR